MTSVAPNARARNIELKANRSATGHICKISPSPEQNYNMYVRLSNSYMKNDLGWITDITPCTAAGGQSAPAHKHVANEPQGSGV